jgi:hypothetical protein
MLCPRHRSPQALDASPAHVLECAGGEADPTASIDHPPHQSKGTSGMALRSKTMTKSVETEETAPEQLSQRRRPEAGQFLLQVDRQTKGSYTTFEAAEAAGLVIKQKFPVVRVAIYDSVTCVNKIIELPQA